MALCIEKKKKNKTLEIAFLPSVLTQNVCVGVATVSRS